MTFNTRRAFVVFAIWLMGIGGVEIYQTAKLAQIDTIIEPLCVTPGFEEACRAALIEASPTNAGNLCRLTAEVLRERGRDASCVVKP